MTNFEKYIQRYLDLIPSENWLEEMELVGSETELFYESLSEEEANFAYSEGKWSLKVLLQHLIETEQVFSYRALRFSKNDATELSGFDEEMFAKESNASKISLGELIEEFRCVRKMSVLFFQNLKFEILQRKGIADGNKLSVETIAKMIIGHNIHHLNVIKDRYLPSLK